MLGTPASARTALNSLVFSGLLLKPNFGETAVLWGKCICSPGCGKHCKGFQAVPPDWCPNEPKIFLFEKFNGFVNSILGYPEPWTGFSSLQKSKQKQFLCATDWLS